jgi:hypothetical protein
MKKIGWLFLTLFLFTSCAGIFIWYVFQCPISTPIELIVPAFISFLFLLACMSAVNFFEEE